MQSRRAKAVKGASASFCASNGYHLDLRRWHEAVRTGPKAVVEVVTSSGSSINNNSSTSSSRRSSSGY